MEAAAAMSIVKQWRGRRKRAASSASQGIPLKEFLSNPLPEESQSEGLQVDLVAPPYQLPDYEALGVSALDILPVELRLQIWEHVMLVPRLVAVEGEARGKDWRSKTPPPVTLVSNFRPSICLSLLYRLLFELVFIPNRHQGPWGFSTLIIAKC